MKDWKKYFCECFGTMTLVTIGCGSAVGINLLLVSDTVSAPLGYSTLAIAFAFGLAVTIMAYVIGGVSGCHINPAVSFGLLVSKRMKFGEFVKYVIAQFIGGILGAAVLVVIFNSTETLGTNGFGDLVWYRAFFVETLLTLFFVLTVLVVSAKKELSNVSGLIIGLSLVAVHIVGIPLTGTSVNPARSFGPALLTGGLAFEQVWLFILAPLAGALIAGLIYKFVIESK